MFCPKCGQQQISDEVRFCSRCGMMLRGVASLIQGGVEPAAETSAAETGFTAAQRGARKGMLIMSGGFGFGLLTVLMTAMQEDFFVLMPVAALVFLIGLMRILYATLLEEDVARRRARKKAEKRAAAFDRARNARELPPAQSFPVNDLAARRTNTTEIAMQPMSVTEGTTRLLDEESDRRS